MKCKRFEIWLANLDPRFGTEAGKTRPVLVIQNDLLNAIHPSTIICPITTNVIKGVSILRVNMQEGEAGMNKESAIMIDQIQAIDTRRLIKKIGQLPSPLQLKVVENLRIVLEIDVGIL